MCGVAGYFDPRRATTHPRNLLVHMAERLAHRGPDETGFVQGRGLGLCSTRLAIIDPRGGQQPRSDAGKRYWLALNGELYNFEALRAELLGLGHSFTTNSDTEVLLAAWLEWGRTVFPRLIGSYAFALYDSLAHRLVLARDPFGKRPLFYTHVGGEVLFASEIKAFLGFPGFTPRFSPRALLDLYSLWTPLPDQSCFEGVRQVPPGHLLEVTPEGCDLWAHYRPTFTPDGPGSMELPEAAALLRETVCTSIRHRLRSDVEIGAYLSGGLDSAIVTAVASSLLGHPPRTFSLGFEQAGYDEGPEQDLLVAALGSEHQRLTITAADIARTFPAALWHAEVPVFRTAFVPMYLLSGLVSEAGIKVVLTGEGADELFLGYDLFKETRLRELIAAGHPREDLLERLRGLYSYLPHFGPQNASYLLAHMQQCAIPPEAELFSHHLRLLGSRLSRDLLALAGSGTETLLELLRREDSGFPVHSSLAKAQWLECTTLLEGYLLSTQGDRMAMAHGVENRTPLLDPAVFRCAANLPETWKLRDGREEKYLLRKAFSDLLPEAILHRVKRPYRAPDARCFLGPDAPPYVAEALRPERLEAVGVFELARTNAFLQRLRTLAPDALSPAQDQAFLLLLSTVLLHEQFIEGHTPPPARPLGSCTWYDMV